MRIGVDAGGSLIKIAYEEKGRLHVRKYDADEILKLIEWLTIIAPHASIIGTGGNWPKVQAEIKQKSHTVDEFTALVEGTKFLLETDKKLTYPFVLASIGTGTSIFYVENDSFERVLGSGVGGGTLMGLGSIISSKTSFHEIVELASNGNRENSDLLVKDIYGNNEAMPLLGDLTAANFGKAHINKESSEADHATALIQLIGEVILSLAGTVATSKSAQHIVFIGSTVSGNIPLQKVLVSFQEKLGYKPVFLEKGAYAGAIGALFN